MSRTQGNIPMDLSRMQQPRVMKSSLGLPKTTVLIELPLMAFALGGLLVMEGVTLTSNIHMMLAQMLVRMALVVRTALVSSHQEVRVPETQKKHQSPTRLL
ncbi:hypothetical protein BDV18DRAFT_149850 [Aspergillus unguis]